MALKDVLKNLFGNGGDTSSKVIDTTNIVDNQLPKEMIEELSNGKGEDE